MASTPNLILDNLVFGLQKNGGGSTYWRAIVNGALSSASWAPVFIETPNSSENICRQSILLPSSQIDICGLLTARFRNVARNYDHKFIFHSSYYRICTSPNALNVVTVHDFTAEQFFRGFRRIYHHWRKGRAIRAAKAIICVSKSTQNDLFKWFPGSRKTPTYVVHNGFGDQFRKRSKTTRGQAGTHALQERDIVFVGHRTEYENFPSGVRAVAKLSASFKLVVVGSPLNEGELALLNRYLPNRYIHHLYPSDKELVEIYSGAHCLLYPSSYEGFGIPLLEAMALGCPVVAVANSSIPEVVADAGLLAHDSTAEALVSQIRRLDDPELRDSMIEKGFRRSQGFSWERTWEQTEQIYQATLNRHGLL